jgi:hypothetical protein
MPENNKLFIASHHTHINITVIINIKATPCTSPCIDRLFLNFSILDSTTIGSCLRVVSGSDRRNRSRRPALLTMIEE